MSEHTHPKEQPINTFVQRHRGFVIGVLNGFDRVRFRGTSPWPCYADGLGKYVFSMKMLLNNLSDLTQEIMGRIRQAAEQIAKKAGRPVEYLVSRSLGAIARS